MSVILETMVKTHRPAALHYLEACEPYVKCSVLTQQGRCGPWNDLFEALQQHVALEVVGQQPRPGTSLLEKAVLVQRQGQNGFGCEVL